MVRANNLSDLNDMFVAQSFYTQWRWTKPADLKRIPRDTQLLFVCGADDKLIPLSHTLRLLDDLPNKDAISLEIVSTSGHQVMEEQPAIVNALLDAFVERVLGSSLGAVVAS